MTEFLSQAADFLFAGMGIGIAFGWFVVLVPAALCAVVHTITKVMNGGR